MIYNTDAIQYFRDCLVADKHYTCCIMDIPDNIGLNYDGFSDRKKPAEYLEWVESLLRLALGICDTIFFTYNHIHHRNFIRLTEKLRVEGTIKRKITDVIWHFTFGQYQDDRFTNLWRPIMIIGDGLNYDGIRTVSDRMRMGDKRAAGLKIPGDVWEFSRVVGNSAERRAWHVTQLPEALVHRMVILGAMKTIDGRTAAVGNVLDPFLGSGTTGIVCERLGVPWDGCEISNSLLWRT